MAGPAPPPLHVPDQKRAPLTGLVAGGTLISTDSVTKSTYVGSEGAASAMAKSHDDSKAKPDCHGGKEEWSDIFIRPTESDTAILLVDASGSVRSQYGQSTTTVFDECRRLAKLFPHRHFKVLYWNSEGVNGGGWQKGVLKLPYVLTKDKFDANFSLASAKISSDCLTYPNLAFGNIDDWLSANFSRTLYLLTDGQMGYSDISPSELVKLKSDVAQSIQALVKRYPDLQIHIVAVETKETDYASLENLKRAAGCDLFNVIQEHKLTQSIASFTSYTPNQPGGFSHIRRVKAPPGSVPFRDSHVAEKHIHKFVSFVRSEVASKRADQDALLKLIQELSVSLAALVRDKTKILRSSLVNLFCDVFDGTALDSVMVRFILTAAIEEESAGSAALFASYRDQLKNLYKSADLLLTRDVRAATAALSSELCITLPMAGLVVSGPTDLMTAAAHIKGRTFPNAALCLPFKTTVSVSNPSLGDLESKLVNSELLGQFGMAKLKIGANTKSPAEEKAAARAFLLNKTAVDECYYSSDPNVLLQVLVRPTIPSQIHFAVFFAEIC
jgi:hypothetical protein